MQVGYDIHITRHEEWGNADTGPQITKEEFKEAVLNDPRFRADSELGPDFAVFTGGPRGVGSPWIQWSHDGNLLSKSPPPELVRAMVEIAERLEARVVGDDGEEYGPDGQLLLEVPANYTVPNRMKARRLLASLPPWAPYALVLLLSTLLCALLVVLGVI